MSRGYLILAARFNDMVTSSLLRGAEETLKQADVKNIDTIWVPGAWELPVAAAKAARSGKWQGIICLGAVIKGDTPHFDYVAGQAASGLMSISIETSVPVVFGVLTTNTVEQALNRAGLKLGNKGSEAAQTALEMTSALKKIDHWSDNIES
ncbi:MAG: 6,7-dimethyl-8-ribityllumazine synthase [Zetaproteobacteria bacterium]|nr:6,7-dimethyl-8-ribityllumazine synthase [Pseudobdellovibrionaceae bacterium]